VSLITIQLLLIARVTILQLICLATNALLLLVSVISQLFFPICLLLFTGCCCCCCTLPHTAVALACQPSLCCSCCSLRGGASSCQRLSTVLQHNTEQQAEQRVLQLASLDGMSCQ
jgi:hypothetical protein